MASSENKESIVFDCKAHFTTMAKKYQVNIKNVIYINYPIGWQTLIQELLEKMVGKRLEIIRICEYFGSLEIEVDYRSKQAKLIVPEYVERARINSSSTCTVCGCPAKRRIESGKIEVICISCKEETADRGETGTWLDKY